MDILVGPAANSSFQGTLFAAAMNMAVSPYPIGFSAGVIGASIMTIVGVLARLVGISTLNIEMMLGSLITGTVGSGSWLIGLAWHLLNGGVFGLIYTAVFMAFWVPRIRMRRLNGPFSLTNSFLTWGAFIGFIHWIVGSLLLGGAAFVHPLIPWQLPAPGYFAMNSGPWTGVGWLALHVLFGAIVGTAVGSFLEPGLVGQIPSDEHRHGTRTSARPAAARPREPAA